MVKNELGSEALIISTKTVRNSKLGLLGKPTLEITAAIDTERPLKQCFDNSLPDTFQLDGGKQHPIKSEIIPVDFTLNPSSKIKSTDYLLADEVNELKTLVKNLSGEISQLHKNNSNPHQHIENYSFPPPHFNSKTFQEKDIIPILLNKGINRDTSRKIADYLYENLTGQELNDPETVDSTIIEAMRGLLHIASPAYGSSSKQQRIAFVGPTGVGKTTTLAKIAASYITNHSHSVALITIDTYRIAAIEQLKVYGEIMHLPVDVVITPEQLKHAIEKHQDKDLILIDTAGRSPRDEFCIAELTTFLSPEFNIDKHLVLSATTRETELLNTIEHFNSLGISSTIFTKIDECSNLGILLNIQIQNSNPLAYVTNGQRVPEDLIEVLRHTVPELIMSQHEGLLHD